MKPRCIAIAVGFCVSLVSTSLVSTSYAQMPKSRQQKLKAVGKELHVTPKQAKQLLPILNAEEPQLQAIRNDPSLSRAEKLQRMWAVHDQSTPQIKALLTPAQFQQLQAHRQERRPTSSARAGPQLAGQARSPRRASKT